MSLPELPDTPYSLFYEQPGDFEDEGYQYVMDEPGYTADQMRAYALQAVEALRPVAMTPSEVTEAFDSELRSSYTDFEAGIRTAEIHHHITQKEQG